MRSADKAAVTSLRLERLMRPDSAGQLHSQRGSVQEIQLPPYGTDQSDNHTVNAMESALDQCHMGKYWQNKCSLLERDGHIMQQMLMEYSGVQRPETRSENVFSKFFCIYFSIITYFIVSKSEKSDFLYNAVHIPPHHIKC